MEFDFIGITESRLMKGISPTTDIKLKDYVMEHTSTESSAGGALLYINKKFSYQPRNNLNIYKSGHLESIFVEIVLPKNLILLLVVFTDIHLWTYAPLMTITSIFFKKNILKTMTKKLRVILILTC